MTSAREQLEEVERDRLSVYVADRRLPGWYWPFLGIATGLMMASHDLDRPFITIPVTILYAALVGGVLGKVLSEAGVVVRFRGMPPGLRRPLIVYMVVTLVVVTGGMIATLFVDVPWSYTGLGIVSAVVMWPGGWWASRVYNARAERLAAERGIRR